MQLLVDVLISVDLHICYLRTPLIGTPVRLADFKKVQSGCGTHILKACTCFQYLMMLPVIPWLPFWIGYYHWPMHLPCTVSQEQAYCASNIVSNSHLLHFKSIDLPIPKTRLLKFDHQNLRSRSWVRSKFKFTIWVHPIDSHPFGSMSIHRLIPMIEIFFTIWPSKSKVKAIAQGHIVL